VLTLSAARAKQASAAIDFTEQDFAPYPIAQDEFDFLRNLARKHAGISLADHKRNMVQRRVARRIAHYRLSGFTAYCAFLKSAEGEQEIEHLINALTTNKTEFFRENHHFEHLGKVVLPSLAKAAQKRIRVWSAGCSSGQEPYSIAITMFSSLSGVDALDAKVLATDIDTDILTRAARGIYSETELAGVPSGIRSSCFSLHPGAPQQYKVNSAIQKLISFRHLNLHGEWPMQGLFDVIFCRNVVIYFDKPTQRELFDRFANLLTPNGYLYIGHSESLFKVSERFQFEGQSIYRKIA
jgi:chemotaxis protein methyltransferase CheR